jgi:hypothetical protein
MPAKPFILLHARRMNLRAIWGRSTLRSRVHSSRSNSARSSASTRVAPLIGRILPDLISLLERHVTRTDKWLNKQCFAPFAPPEWEFHPEPLTDPDLILSHHPARATARRLPPSAEPSGSSRHWLEPVVGTAPWCWWQVPARLRAGLALGRLGSSLML